ncbi:MAG: glycosyltransferase family 2 protein [Candidatus Omnitrophica bacterium]|nr:glycosyltransferase family 2 protein [Candidatus Omnitrophota bacterium]
MRLSVIVPCHNEEDNIASVIRRIEDSLDVPHELVVVNDHSSDQTAAIVAGLSEEYKNIRLVENRSEKGFANALRTGFASSSAEVVVPVMADLCDDLRLLGPMLEKIDAGYDVVCASRYTKGGKRLGGSRLKGFLSCWGGRSLSFLLGLPTHDIANAFKMYRKKVLDSVKSDARGFEISMELPLKAYYAGFRITELPTTWRERTAGRSSFKIFRLLPSYIKLYFWAISRRLKG